MESEGSDILDLFDKLKSTKLDKNGLTLLKSMAISIRDALEKGELLEQMLVDEKNKLIELQTTKKKKKKKKKHTTESEINESFIQENKQSYKPIEPLPIKGLEIPPPPAENVPTLSVVVNDKKMPIIESKVRLVDQSLLLNSSFNMSMNQPTERIVSPHSCNCNLSRMSSSPLNGPLTMQQCNVPLSGPLIMQQNISPQSLINQPYMMQSVPLDNRVNMFNQFTNSLFNGVPNSEPDSGLLMPKVEPIDPVITELPSEPNLTKPTYSSVLKQPPSQPVEEEACMPSPIMIKSEILQSKTPPPPYDISLNIIKPVETPEGNKSIPATSNDKENGLDKELETPYSNRDDKTPESQNLSVYFETGKDATEEEVRAIVKDLDISSFKLIHRPLYTFGFIRFASEEHKQVAISYSKKFFIQGKVLFIRACGERRNIKAQKRPSDSHQNSPTKRPKYSEESKNPHEDNYFPRNPKYTPERRKTTGAASDHEGFENNKSSRNRTRSSSIDRVRSPNNSDDKNEALEHRLSKESHSSHSFNRSRPFERSRPHSQRSSRDHYQNSRMRGRNFRHRGNSNYRGRR